MNKYISFSVVTAFWLIFAIVGWVAAIAFKEKAVIRCCIVLTAVCCWLVWAVTFVMQLNPLVGPRVNQITLWAMMAYWKNSHVEPPHTSSTQLVTKSTPLD